MGIKTRNFANNILSGGTIDGTDFLSGTLPSSNITNDSAASVTSIPSISNVVSTVAGDPPSPTLGDIWYNSSTNALKFQGFQAAAFSSGGNLNTAQYDVSGTGVLTAQVQAGGYNGSTRTALTENYDGTTWTSSATKPTAVFAGGMAGTQTAAWYASGNNAPGGGRTSSTEEYDGAAWTAGGNVNTARQQIAAQNGGTLTAGIIFGGNGGPTATETYDGTSWTTEPATVNDGRWNGMGTGNQTAAVLAGADNPATSNVEEYNGTSWSEVNNMPEIRYSGATIGNSQTDYIVATGQTPAPALITNSISYDGTSWATGASNSLGRGLLGGSSQTSTASGVIYGGFDPGFSPSSATEEYTGATALTKTFTTD